MPAIDPSIARGLVLDELFDLTLYQHVRRHANGETAKILDELIRIETRHLGFWRELFGIEGRRLDISRQVKLWSILLFSRLFGRAGIHLILESIEILGARKYLLLWEAHKDDAFGAAIAPILQDEIGHEELIISSEATLQIKPERVRDLFLGFNDGLVEVLGAVSGFFAVFGTPLSIILAGLTVSVAGSLSMAAGAYAAVGSATDIEDTERMKRAFLKKGGEVGGKERPLLSALIVGVSYFIGAMVPLVPVFFGAENLVISSIISLIAAIIISYLVAFLTGMSAARRIAINVASIILAVGITYGIGLLARYAFGVSV